MKKWYRSRTILLQLVTAVLLVLRLSGVEVADDSGQDIVDAIGVGVILLSNIALRFKTTEAIE